MGPVLDSVMHDHDARLVLLAAAICAFGAICTVSVCGRALRSGRTALWLVLLSVCAGATVWATHFIAMLAYRQGMATTYDVALTVLSFASGVVIMGLGFVTALRGRNVGLLRLLGGAVLGMGVVVLHYVGMAALRLPGELTYAPSLVMLSIVFSVLFGAPVLALTFGPVRAYGRTLAAVLMVLMIVSLHFTAMGAVHVHDNMVVATPAGGVTRSVLATAVAIASLSVLLIGMAGAVIDQKVSHRLAAEAERFRTLADGAFEGLVVHRSGVVVDANAAAQRMLGLRGTAPYVEPGTWFEQILELPPQTVTDEAVEVMLQRADGSSFPAEVCRRRIALADGGEGELCAIRDVTVRKESEARIAHLALHDSLTGLPNRRFFMELAAKTLAQAARAEESFAVLALDLDDFKQINDTHGHAAGDNLIRIAANRIAATLRDADIAARLGGDEFVIVQTGAASARSAVALAERLLEALGAPVQLDYGEAVLSMSIGIAFYPQDGATVQDLLRNADTALYRAKGDGKSMSRCFEPEMDAALVTRRRLERGLRRAVARNELTLAYQPIVESVSRRPLGFEALVRWTDPDLGAVSPAEFIPVAEETGLIVPIGEFVVRQACFEALNWPDHLRVAVNLSAVQFRRRGLVQMVQSALADSGLAGDRLELEVTETLLVENRIEALRQLNELKALGVHISMDDFGTGYSALSYLQSFPFDKIKIDRVFVTELSCNPQNESIVRAVAAMGRSLHMRVVAEGVETDQEADILRNLDCDEIQGYLIARPMRAVDVLAFLYSHGAIRAPRRLLHTA